MNQTTAAPSGAATVSNIAYCYVLPCVCVIGIIGNVTNLIVLGESLLMRALRVIGLIVRGKAHDRLLESMHTI